MQRWRVSPLSEPMIWGSSLSSISAFPSSVRSGQTASSNGRLRSASSGATTLRAVPSFTVERSTTSASACITSATCRVARSTAPRNATPSFPNGVPTVRIYTVAGNAGSTSVEKVKLPFSITRFSLSSRRGSQKCALPSASRSSTSWRRSTPWTWKPLSAIATARVKPTYPKPRMQTFLSRILDGKLIGVVPQE